MYFAQPFGMAARAVIKARVVALNSHRIGHDPPKGFSVIFQSHHIDVSAFLYPFQKLAQRQIAPLLHLGATYLKRTLPTAGDERQIDISRSGCCCCLVGRTQAQAHPPSSVLEKSSPVVRVVFALVPVSCRLMNPCFPVPQIGLRKFPGSGFCVYSAFLELGIVA